MDLLKVLAGIVCLAIGVYISIIQIKIFQRGEQDELGWDIKLFGGGIIGIVLGIALIIKFL